jgi:hypothetical protein
VASLALVACGTPFPTVDDQQSESSPFQVPDGTEIFERSLQAHELAEAGQYVGLRNLRVATTGTWPWLVTKVQPLMTDDDWRTDGDEYLDLQTGYYEALFTGPAGSKRVLRTRQAIEVYYNGVPSDDDDVLKASALTSDAAWLFYLGPRALQNKQYAFTRLADTTENGRIYYRIHSTVQPGFGFSEQDQLVFWIDPDTHLVYRTHMTLNGFRNTRGAHVDVTVREYQQVDGQVLPQRLFERVRGPIAIDVHDWWTTAIELNTKTAAVPAAPQ